MPADTIKYDLLDVFWTLLGFNNRPHKELLIFERMPRISCITNVDTLYSMHKYLEFWHSDA